MRRNRRFEFVTGDVNYLDYGGTWGRKLTGNRFHFIRLINWEESCGRDAPKEKYNVELSEVDLDEISAENIESAKRCSGIEGQGFDITPLWLAETCLSYGLHAPLWSEDGNNFAKLFKQAAYESTRVQEDLEYREERMSRPVNKLGSTAEEYMRGDLDSAMFRGLAAGDPSARIMAKMQGYRLKEEIK